METNKVFVVVDHICEADIVIAVFSEQEAAKKFVSENSWPRTKHYKYESLAIEEFVLDEEAVKA